MQRNQSLEDLLGKIVKGATANNEEAKEIQDEQQQIENEATRQ